METVVNYRGGVQFEVNTRGHQVICDQPADNGGADAGITPPEFLLASLGTCAAFYAAQYLRTRSLPTDGLEVRVSAEKAQAPARLGSFQIEIRVPGLADEKHQAGVMRAAKSCLIHNTLMQPPTIEMTLNTETAGRAGR